MLFFVHFLVGNWKIFIKLTHQKKIYLEKLKKNFQMKKYLKLAKDIIDLLGKEYDIINTVVYEDYLFKSVDKKKNY